MSAAALASASSTSLAGMRTLAPSTKAPARAKYSTAGPYLTSIPVSTSTSRVASCTRLQASSFQITRRALFMPPLLSFTGLPRR